MKQPLLLLHGALSSAKQFFLLQNILSEKYDVHTLNFPGHGGEDIPPEFSIPLFADTVLHYMDEKNITSVNIFGYSMGGYVALYVAAHHPGRVNKIFTLATKFDWTPQSASRETSMLNPEVIMEKVPAFAKSLEQMHSPQDWKVVLSRTSDLLMNLGNKPALSEKELQNIDIPVVISVGELDKMVTVEESSNAAHQIKNGSFCLFPSTPHPFEKVNHSTLAEKMNEYFD